MFTPPRSKIAGALVLAIALLAGLGWARWMAEGAALGREHARFEATHPGWSFPARVYSPALPIAGLTLKRKLAEARLRGYTENCLAKELLPGTFCEKSQRIIPRAGDSTLEPLLLGRLIGPDSELRTHLPLADAPKGLLDAIVASEDRDFRSHHGVSFTGVARALFANTKDGQYSQGASTLTMQVVRSLSQKTEKSLTRKLREMALAMGLERELGKDAVLQMYLDAPYLGQRGTLSICGFAEAAHHYFDKDIQKLDLAELATLVAILPGPGKLAPDHDREACRARRNRVLAEMARLYHYDVKAALEAPIILARPPPLPELFPTYLSVVRAKLEAQLPRPQVYGSGLVVETSIDLVMQQEAEKLFPAKAQAYEGLVSAKKGTLQAVGIALDVQTGLVRAVYGGNGASVWGFNRATQAHRQPGSSFKPLVYALAFSTHNPDGSPKYSASSTEPNSPREFKTPQGKWTPLNVGGEATPTACLAEGLAWSQNIATASLLEELGGPAPLIALAKKAGFDTTAFPQELGLALGQAEVTPIEMAQFVGMIANGGRRLEGTPVRRAVDASGAERVHPPQSLERVLEPEAAALTRELMRLVIDFGTGGAIRGVAGETGYLGPAIGKTGTTDSEKDLWFVGATPSVAMVVWLGYDMPARLGASAADFAAPLWGWWMGKASQYDATPLPDFPKQPALLKQGVCTQSGLLPNPSCKVILAPFLPGTAPKGSCTLEHEAVDPGFVTAAHESLWKRRDREAAEADAGVTAEPVAPSEPEPAEP
jgi:membrane peptidoglycan carboxypeptidase